MKLMPKGQWWPVPVFAAVLSIFLGSSCATTPKVSTYTLPPYRELKLKNGLNVLLIKDNELPYISIIGLVRAGSFNDSIPQSGLANMAGSLLERGSRGKSAPEIADAFGNLGAEFNSSVDKDYALFSVEGLALHEDQLLKEFAEILTQPSFKNEEIERARREILAALEKASDSPHSFARRIFESYIFGNHPYSKPSLGTMVGVKSLKRKDIVQFYEQFYRPNNTYLAVVGKYSDTLGDKLEQVFGGWQAQDLKPMIFPEVKDSPNVQIELVNKEDLAQSEIYMGHLGIKRSNPDYIPLRVANTILGSGFLSRLMDEIRVKRGLTYGIDSSFPARLDFGPFVVGTSTRHEKVQEVISESMNVIRKFREEGVTEEELKQAKAYLAGVFPQALQTPEDLAENLLFLRYYGISDNYLRDYLGNLSAVTQKDVNEVIKKYFRPDNMKIVILGPQSKIIDQARPIGVVKAVKYTEFLR